MVKISLSYHLFLLFILVVVGSGRSVPPWHKTASSSSSSSYGRINDLVSDGLTAFADQLDRHDNRTYPLTISLSVPPKEACEQMYGFLPCSSSRYGDLFLIVVYEYLLFHGESYVAEGGERIIKILGPGVFGASAFHVLGALPESLLLLASGLSSTKDEAQEYVLNGVGLVAGSSILLLTLVWATCLIVARPHFSINNNNNYNDKSTKLLTTLSLAFKRLKALLTGNGISTDSETSYVARIMVLSVIPFLIMAISNINKDSSWQRIAILVALSVSLVLLLMYFLYQFFEPWILHRRLEYMRHANLTLSIVQNVRKRCKGRILTDDGAPNVDAIRRVFDEADEDHNSFASALENGWEEVEKVMEEVKKRVSSYKDESLSKSWAKGIAYLAVGITMVSILADPLIDSVQNFSQSVGASSFFISFILVPLATNARVATAAISTASRQTPRTTSLTFSEIYGGVFMNNIMGFSVLLCLIYFREIEWELTTEILVVIIVCFLVGIIASFRSKFALWTAILAYFLYPFSLLFVYLFNHVLHYT